MIRNRLLWRLYAGYVAIIVISTLVVDLWVVREVTKSSMLDVERSLAINCSLLEEISRDALRAHSERPDEPAAPATRAGGRNLQQTVTELGRRTGTRLTVIANDGLVLADSDELPARMDNHGQRPEVFEARQSGEATRIRFSRTLQKRMVYHALRVTHGGDVTGFVRVSLPYVRIDDKLAELRRLVLIGAGLAALAALVLGFYFAKRFSDPIIRMIAAAEAISQGDFGRQIPVSGDDEIGRLAEAVNRMGRSSAQRMAELTTDRNRLSKIFTGMVEGVIGVDVEQRIIHINQAAADLLGIQMNECLYKPIWTEVRADEIRSALTQALETQDVVRSQMRRSAASDDLVVDIAAATLRDEDGEPAGAVIVLHDISELAHLERVRRDFVANASHELKTPITAIQGLSETILDDEGMDRDTRQRFLERIHAQSLRLSTLISDLMTISRFEADEFEANLNRIDLAEVARRSVAEARPECVEKQLGLTLELPDHPVFIEADMQAISQLIDNLLDNAHHYTPSGGEIIVRLSTDSSHARLSIEDTGIGISPQYQQRIFERFYRVDKARSRGLGGTGLGLSIVKNIAEAHNGTVSVESQLGKGSTFTVTLPLAV